MGKASDRFHSRYHFIFTDGHIRIDDNIISFRLRKRDNLAAVYSTQLLTSVVKRYLLFNFTTVVRSIIDMFNYGYYFYKL